jgi:hypothetical protein
MLLTLLVDPSCLSVRDPRNRNVARTLHARPEVPRLTDTRHRSSVIWGGALSCRSFLASGSSDTADLAATAVGDPLPDYLGHTGISTVLSTPQLSTKPVRASPNPPESDPPPRRRSAPPAGASGTPRRRQPQPSRSKPGPPHCPQRTRCAPTPGGLSKNSWTCADNLNVTHPTNRRPKHRDREHPRDHPPRQGLRPGHRVHPNQQQHARPPRPDRPPDAGDTTKATTSPISDTHSTPHRTRPTQDTNPGRAETHDVGAATNRSHSSGAGPAAAVSTADLDSIPTPNPRADAQPGSPHRSHRLSIVCGLLSADLTETTNPKGSAHSRSTHHAEGPNGPPLPRWRRLAASRPAHALPLIGRPQKTKQERPEDDTRDKPSATNTPGPPWSVHGPLWTLQRRRRSPVVSQFVKPGHHSGRPLTDACVGPGLDARYSTLFHLLTHFNDEPADP